MQWGDFLIVVVISGKFILLVPGSHMFLNHYGMWFSTTDERLLRKNTPSVQKLKVKHYLFLFSPLPQAKEAEAGSCPEAVLGIIFRPVPFILPPANTYKPMLVLNLPASKRTTVGPIQPAGGAPHWDRRGRAVHRQGPSECCSPPAVPWCSHGPPMMLLLQGNSLPKRCAREGRRGKKQPRRSCSPVPGRLCWHGRSSPASDLHQKQM